MKKNFWIKKFKTGIQAITTRLGATPKGSGWQQVFLGDDCCQFFVPTNVQFNCVGPSFYIEFIDLEGNVAVGIYSNEGSESFLSQIPKGTFDIVINGFDPNQPVFINGVQVGNADGSGNFSLEDYDTTSITSIGGCGENGEPGNIDIDVQFIWQPGASDPELLSNEEVAEQTQLKIFAADGITLLAQTTLGGATLQAFTIPYGDVIFCLNRIAPFPVDVDMKARAKDDNNVQIGLFPPITTVGEECIPGPVAVTAHYDVVIAGASIG